MQLTVADLADRAVVGFENQRGLVGARGKMAVEAVVRDVQRAVFEPFVERRCGIVERTGERRVPRQMFARKLRPVAGIVGLGLSAQGAISLHAGNIRLRNKRGLRRENAGFSQNRFDGGHTMTPQFMGLGDSGILIGYLEFRVEMRA